MKSMFAAGLTTAIGPRFVSAGDTSRRPPNVVLIFTDDLGYGDLGCYGAEDIPTPRIDQMASEGLKLTDFYVAAPVCTPARASLLTGCYPQRVGMPGVVHPHDNRGLNPDEMTLGDMFQVQGYRTACFGKWHLGHHEPHRPPNHGFDESLYTPYSHDMYRGAPWGGNWTENPDWPEYVPVLRDHEEVDQLHGLDDFSTMTRLFTEATVDFIRQSEDNPFFAYLPHPMPHLELKPPERWEGVSQRGPYGDVVAELDWSTGKILDTLKELGIEDNTLVVFTSDNGPAVQYQRPRFEGGCAGPLRGRKNTPYEGGFRVPCVLRWPGVIPAGSVSSEVVTAMDFLPTFAGMLEAGLPDHPIDGHDMMPLLQQPKQAQSPYDAFYYYRERRLRGVRSDEWKLMAARPEYNNDGELVVEHDAKLFNLQEDIGESTDLAEQHPQKVEELEGRVQQMREQLGDHIPNHPGPQPYPATQARPALNLSE
ncbi:MAG: sulfatase [Candidatus Brocadiia bacterium]